MNMPDVTKRKVNVMKRKVMERKVRQMNMSDVTKRKVGLQLPIATIIKIDKVGKSSGLSRNGVPGMMPDKATAGIILGDSDLEKVNSKTRSNHEKRNRKQKL
jgi:hypothetical protein